MFAYCNNNPSCCSDNHGSYPVFEFEQEIEETKPNPPINGQGLEPYSSMAYGTSTIGEYGCTAIGTYNAMNLAGYSMDLNTIISYYEWRWYFLHHGTPTWLIGGCLSTLGAKYTHSYDSAIIEQCKNGGAVIVNVFNRRCTTNYCTVPGMGHEKNLWTTAEIPSLTDGMHTVAITYQNGSYHVYNYNNTLTTANPFADYSDYLKERWFFDAYYVYPAG